MRQALAVVLLAFSISDADMSRRLTKAAEDLLAAERKAAAVWREAGQPDNQLYEDVLAMLDTALDFDPKNLHARAVAADLLLAKAYDGEVYDVCFLLDARADAGFVVTHASRAAAADLATAQRVLRSIEAIPKDEIPDPPSSCDEEDHGPTTTAARPRA